MQFKIMKQQKNNKKKQTNKQERVYHRRHLKRFALRQHDRTMQRKGAGVYSRQIFHILKLTFVFLFL